MIPDDPRPDGLTPRATQADHLRAWDLLPWVVNGRATPEQAQWVDAHVATCEDCRAELAWQRWQAGAVADIATLEPIYLGEAVKARPQA